LVVYIDVLMFENFIVNAFLLSITAQTLRVRSGIKLLLISAAAGAIYVITMLYPELTIFTRLPFQILVAAIMVGILFKSKKLFFIFKGTALFILYSMLLSGFCVFIQYKHSVTNLFSYELMDFDYRWLLLAIMILYTIIYRFVVFIQDRQELGMYTYEVEIVTKKISLKVKAFLDTGNELREPVTNLPVMIVEKNILGALDLKESEKLYIPYKVVNGFSGRMEGFRPEFVKIYYEEKKFELRNVVIAVCEDKLSELDEYEALLSRGIV
jgi:stage II sporulation protein GA (sporulation sigma-E factor processing peptidase)